MHRPRIISVLFDMLDVDRQKILGHDAMFRLYKTMFSNAVSDDHILALTFSALRHPNLGRDDEVTRDEFADVSLSFEIKNASAALAPSPEPYPALAITHPDSDRMGRC